MEASAGRPLGDTPSRAYASKIALFAEFAQPELRRILGDLALGPGSAVVDLGCGTGLTTRWLSEDVGASGRVVGLDLSMPHLRVARENSGTPLIQADLERPCFRGQTFDLAWCCNTINHLGDPVRALSNVRRILRPPGRIALAQSGLLPEMYFAWDSQLDQEVYLACRAYYRAKYGLSVADTTSVRGLLRLLEQAHWRRLGVRTYVIERTQPLTAADRAYFADVVFEGYWGLKLRPYLSEAAWSSLRGLCDPSSRDFCLERSDFHHIQTLTVAQGAAF